MAKGVLYDIKNHNGYFDGLTIMETLNSNSFKLIFMELPALKPSSEHIYDMPNYGQERNINSEFLYKCIENARRLLFDDGVLVLFAPKTTFSNQNYYLLLSQFFGTVTDFIQIHEYGSSSCSNSYFFCSPQKNFEFPGARKPPLKLYPFKDERDHYRLISPFINRFNENDRLYTWKGFSPAPKYGWMFSETELNELWTSDKIIIKENNIFLKKYRFEEPVHLSPLWNEHYEAEKHWHPCNQKSIDHILALCCAPNDSVFCPFDLFGFFPIVAHKHELNWTSIKMHTGMTYIFSGLSQDDYVLISELPNATNNIHYRDDIIGNITDLEDLKCQVKELSTPLFSQSLLNDIESLIKHPLLNRKATGANLKRLRQEANLSVQDVADQYCGEVSTTTIYNWEDGKHLPKTPERFAKLVMMYGVSSFEQILVFTTPK